MPSLYVHVPFCLKKCDYCAFYSVSADEAQISSYMHGIECEILLRQLEAPQGVSSLFLGGGTPTTLQAGDIAKLLSLIHEYFVMKGNNNTAEFPSESNRLSSNMDNSLSLNSIEQIEMTMEANPGTLDIQKLAVMLEYGINRISLGAQSFNDKLLRSIGRIHSAQDIRTGVELIRKAGFNNLNLDLIFGLPGQTVPDWQETVKKAVELAPEHLSLYGLALEEGTPLANKYSYPNSLSDLLEAGTQASDLPDDDSQAAMMEWAVEFLQDKGYGHYEVSNFARPGCECKHNLSYWNGYDYIGLGPGAASCSRGKRTKNREDVPEYRKLLANGKTPFDEAETEELTREQRISEYMMLGLRTVYGIEVKVFAEKFKVELQDIYGHKLVNYMDREVIFLKDGRVRINPNYFFVANAILRDFIL